MNKKILHIILLYIPFLIANLFVHGIYGVYEFIIDTHKEILKIYKNSVIENNKNVVDFLILI